MRAFLITTVVLVAASSFSPPSNVDPDHRFDWSENIGWTNWRTGQFDANNAVHIARTALSGLVWSENTGWINLGDGSPADGTHYANADDGDFGVNVDPANGDLFGMAWGENIGWINFAGGAQTIPSRPARVDFCTRRLMGYAWSENVGWINLDDSIRFIGLGPCRVGDFYCDELLRLDDYGPMPSFLDGPGILANCPAFDSDDDGDIDLADFAVFQEQFYSP